MIRRPRTVMFSGGLALGELRLMKKAALARIGSPSPERSRTGPGPTTSRQAPFDAIVVPLWLIHRPRVV